MTLTTGKRLYRACVRCRKRKTRCDLSAIGEPGLPPCKTCHNEGHECVLASSRRGGDFSHARKKSLRSKHARSQQHIGQDVLDELDADSLGQDLRLKPAETVPDSPSSDCGNIQNPSDALRALQSAPQCEQKDVVNAPNATAPVLDPCNEHCLPSSDHQMAEEDYPPIASGDISLDMMGPLIELYATKYHPFMPIAPASALSVKNLRATILAEPFLLTAILTVATKDKDDLHTLHQKLWIHMQNLIVEVTLGSDRVRVVGSVEGILLLSEWIERPGNRHNSPGQAIKVDTEDCAAWALIGAAVRQGYLLRLDQYSFRDANRKEQHMAGGRKLLAWTFTYLSDRQISIRMGQAFWCRGPGLSTRFTADDYPSLRPNEANATDLACVLQAQVEITTLFGNIHDVLYASKTRTAALMLAGDYNKYIDDGIKALTAWRAAWKDIKAPSWSCSLLQILYDYLGLYTHAFAFQAVLYRASRVKRSRKATMNLATRQQESHFPNGLMESPDANHIYQAITCARRLLKTITEDLDPEHQLRFLPVRFYLYEIHAAVFLAKVYSYGAVSLTEHQTNMLLIRGFVEQLNRAASSASHIASRYSSLLSALTTGMIAPSDGTIPGDLNLQERRSIRRPGDIDCDTSSSSALGHDCHDIAPAYPPHSANHIGMVSSAQGYGVPGVTRLPCNTAKSFVTAAHTPQERDAWALDVPDLDSFPATGLQSSDLFDPTYCFMNFDSFSSTDMTDLLATM